MEAESARSEHGCRVWWPEVVRDRHRKAAILPSSARHALVAQRIERLSSEQKVRGSSPCERTNEHEEGRVVKFTARPSCMAIETSDVSLDASGCPNRLSPDKRVGQVHHLWPL